MLVLYLQKAELQSEQEDRSVPARCKPGVAAVKRAVRQRDGRCLQCGVTAEEYRQKTGIELDVHRLIPGSKYALEGCVTLCKECHKSKPRRPWGLRALDALRLNDDMTKRI